VSKTEKFVVHCLTAAVPVAEHGKSSSRLNKRGNQQTPEKEKLPLPIVSSRRDFVSTVLNITPALVLTLDYNGRIVQFNAACEKVLGYTAGEVVGKAWTCLLPDEGVSKAIRRFEKLRRKRSGFFRDRWRSREGETRLIEWRSGCLTNARGDIEFIIQIGLDITGQRHLEHDGRARLEQMARLHRLHTMGEVAGLLAHQINQPLAAIRSLSEASLAGLEGNKPDLSWVRKNLEDLVVQSERAAQVIRELRAFLKRQPQKKVKADLNAVVQSACALMVIPDSRIIVDRNFDETLPPIWMRPIHIEQVIVCLLQNAIEEMLENGNKDKIVRIRTRLVDKNNALVTVQDNGRGFNDRTASRVFDLLYTTKKNGIGLGLSISRSIIEEHDGRIWAEPGTSGIFHFTLPVAQ